MSYSLEFTIQGLPKVLSNMKRNGWRGVWAEKKKWKGLVRDMVILKGGPKQPLEKAKLTLTRHSSKPCDFDGIVSSFKGVIDGLTEAGVIVDDNMEVIGQPQFLWAKAPMKQGKITVKIEEVL